MSPLLLCCCFSPFAKELTTISEASLSAPLVAASRLLPALNELGTWWPWLLPSSGSFLKLRRSGCGGGGGVGDCHAFFASARCRLSSSLLPVSGLIKGLAAAEEDALRGFSGSVLKVDPVMLAPPAFHYISAKMQATSKVRGVTTCGTRVAPTKRVKWKEAASRSTQDRPGSRCADLAPIQASDEKHTKYEIVCHSPSRAFGFSNRDI